MGDLIELALRLKDEASKALQGVAKEAAGADTATGGLTQTALALNAGLLAVAGGAAAAVTAMFEIAKSAGDLSDHFTQMSAQVGIDANTLIALDSVARQSGTTLDTMTFGLKSLTETLVAAAGGNETAGETFAKLGVAVTDSHGKMRDAESVLRDVADALVGVNDDTERAALAMEVFGSRGAVVASALANGSAALDEWGAKAREAGLIIDTEAVAAADRWDASMEELRLTLAGIKQTVGEESIPMFVEFAKAITPLAHAASSLIGPFLAFSDVMNSILLGPLKLLWAGLVALTDAFTDFLDELNAVPGIVEESTAGVYHLAVAVESTSRIYEDNTIKGETLAQAFDRMGKSAAANATKVMTLADALAKIGFGAAEAAAARATIESAQAGGAAFGAELFSALLEVPTIQVGMDASTAAQASRTFSEALAKTMDAPAESFASKASEAMSDLGDFLKSKGAVAAGGLLSGDVSGALAATGPVGAAIGGVAAIGDLGAKGVREQLMGFEKSLMKGLKALPKIISDIIPDFAIALITDFIPALIEAAPKIFEALIVELPLAIANALWDVIKNLFGDRNEKQESFLEFIDPFNKREKGEKAFGVGTMSVDRTGLALVHRGEQVVQAGARAKQGTGGAPLGGVSLTINTLTLDPNGALRVVQLLEQFLNPASGRYRSSVLGTAPAAD